jgi:bifunctional DNA-binding transcriptional regulator/antitoxin component of YhaV-PrlF toxin-antitoxin module
MNYVQKITKIRGRGQMTVPQEARRALNWPEDELIVRVESTISGFRVERLPVSHPQSHTKKMDQAQWQSMLRSMKNVSKSGKTQADLANVLRKDRDSHF